MMITVNTLVAKTKTMQLDNETRLSHYETNTSSGNLLRDMKSSETCSELQSRHVHHSTGFLIEIFHLTPLNYKLHSTHACFK
jgi:hypothetical protein